MFKAAKELRSSFIRNSLKSLVVALLIRKFQVCAVRTICIGTLNEENIWLQRRKMEKLLEDNKHIVCFFFRALLLWLETRKQKQGRGEMIQEAVRKTWKNLVIIIVAFLSRLCLIGLSMVFRHLQNIYQENLYLFIINTVTSVGCSLEIYLPFIQIISIFQYFLGNSN